jgi:hypothetical protein
VIFDIILFFSVSTIQEDVPDCQTGIFHSLYAAVPEKGRLSKKYLTFWNIPLDGNIIKSENKRKCNRFQKGRICHEKSRRKPGRPGRRGQERREKDREDRTQRSCRES